METPSVMENYASLPEIRDLILIITFTVTLATVIWFFLDPGPEPVVSFLTSLVSLISALFYARQGKGNSMPDKTHRDRILAFQTPKRVSKVTKNHFKIPSTFLDWEQCTLMLWAYIPQKGQALRNGDTYRYLLSHRSSGEADTSIFALRYFPSEDNQWGLWISNNRGERCDLNVEDVLESGWHHFLIGWDHSKPELVFQIDLGTGGNKHTSSYLSCWPKPEENSVVLGSWVDYPHPPYIDSYCETLIYQVQILPIFLGLDSSTVTAHWKMGRRISIRWLGMLEKSRGWLHSKRSLIENPNPWVLAIIGGMIVGVVLLIIQYTIFESDNNQTSFFPTQTSSLLHHTSTATLTTSTDTPTPTQTPSPVTPSVATPSPSLPTFTYASTRMPTATPTLDFQTEISTASNAPHDESPQLAIERGAYTIALCVNEPVNLGTLELRLTEDRNGQLLAGKLVFGDVFPSSTTTQAGQCWCLQQKGAQRHEVPSVCSEQNTKLIDPIVNIRFSSIEIRFENSTIGKCSAFPNIVNNTYRCGNISLGGRQDE